MVIILLSLLLVVAISTMGYSRRYWVRNTAGSWSATNWSLVAGGPALVGPPSSVGQARFGSYGTGNCTVDASVTVAGIIITTDYTGTISCGNNTITINNTILGESSTFTGGSITGNAGTSALNISTTGTVTFSGTNIGVDCDVNAGTIYLNGSNFGRTLDATHNTATGTISSTGGNTFNGVTTITNATSGTCRY